MLYPIAAVANFNDRMCSYCDRCFDPWMRFIVDKFNILIIEFINRGYLWVQLYLWELFWHSRKLKLNLLHMVLINMNITKGVNKFASFQTTYLCHHFSK